MRKIPFFLILILTFFSTALWAAPATVTNQGNITVRVQYKTPDGEYQDMYVKPGETANLGHALSWHLRRQSPPARGKSVLCRPDGHRTDALA